MVVTRFAPSPTGYLHIGGARTALFCWLFARHTGGTFILRIEDTDQKRNTPTAIQQVISDLRWLGIDWDEGPETGGPSGPYLQSQRMDIYEKYLQTLIDEKKAYYCFDTTEELQEMRDEATADKKGFTYKRPDVFPDESDVKKARAQGKSVVVRFAMPNTDIIVSDIIRGQVRFGAAEMGDFIIQKSDGFPTYHFACVVDDELMNITHVIRGQEHLMNTPYHQALQQALGFKTPNYAHMSVTISQGGGKLSKREKPKALIAAIKSHTDLDLNKLASVGGIAVEDLKDFIAGNSTPDMPAVDSMAKYLGVHLPEINVVDFFKSGYLPETMINFLSLLGWSTGDKREVMPVNELIECFDITRLAKTNSFFDRDKLIAFNTEHIRMVGEDKLLEHFKKYLKAIDSPVLSADDITLKTLLRINAGARTLADIDKKSRFLFMLNDHVEYDDSAVKKILLKPGALEILAVIRDRLAALDELTEEKIETMLRSLAEEKQVGLGKVAQPLRVSICGTTISPPIFDSVNLLGKDNTLKRIDIAIKKFSSIAQ
ncbi:MAG: glutamate--tRNA ligase [Candidatus Brocadiia bacterium]|nr:MAG: glutamate--tRNA ligase [Candidatus Brocadiia bacterium]